MESHGENDLSQHEPTDPDFLAALEAALELSNAGPVDAVAFRRDFPEHADEVLRRLDFLRALENLRPLSSPQSIEDATTDAAPTRLGEFEILAEIGRGGMGVVYEAPPVRRSAADRG